MSSLQSTPFRLELLRSVEQGTIRYDPNRAMWFRDEEIQRGWGARALNELRREDCIELDSGNLAVLTENGKTLMADGES